MMGALAIKVDSDVNESNVDFPTDLNLTGMRPHAYEFGEAVLSERLHSVRLAEGQRLMTSTQEPPAYKISPV